MVRARMTRVDVASGKKMVGARSSVAKSKMVSYADSGRLNMLRKPRGSDIRVVRIKV
jgi:hypothetical protein